MAIGTEFMVVKEEDAKYVYLGLPDMRNGGYRHVWLTHEQAHDLSAKLMELCQKDTESRPAK